MIRFWILDLGLRISTFQIPDFKDMAMRLIGDFETTSGLLKKKFVHFENNGKGN